MLISCKTYLATTFVYSLSLAHTLTVSSGTCDPVMKESLQFIESEVIKFVMEETDQNELPPNGNWAQCGSPQS